MTTHHRKTGRWQSIGRFGKRGALRGCWLVNPSGERVAMILDHAWAVQLASAMNLTTLKQRTDYAADASLGRFPPEQEEEGPTLTPTLLRTLFAVEKGKVVRVYRANGNSFRAGSGVASAVLLYAEGAKLIAEGPCSGVVERRCQMVLTAAGRALLKGAK